MRILIVAALAVVLITVHGFILHSAWAHFSHGLILHYVSSHLILSVGAVLGLTLLIVIKHFGLAGSVLVLFRDRMPKR